MNIKVGLKRSAIALVLFIAFAMGSVLIPILMTHRRAEAMQKKLQPGMRWSEVARILDLDRKWFFLTFKGNDPVCGAIHPEDGKLIFFPSAPGSKRIELKSLEEDLVLKQVASCPRLSILYHASTSPEHSAFSIGLSSGIVVSHGGVESGD